MKSTNNAQTNETVNEKAIAPTWQSHIVEDLSDETQAAVSGGAMRYITLGSPEYKQLMQQYAGQSGG